MPTERLYVGVGSTPPDLGGVETYRKATIPVGGAPVVFEVIGSSHYLHSEALDYYEVCSCEPVDAETVDEIHLTGDLETTYTYSLDGIEVATDVETRDLDAFDFEATYDLRYDFEPRAVTAIDVHGTSYETYHTYPEFDRTLYTRTSIAGDRVDEYHGIPEQASD